MVLCGSTAQAQDSTASAALALTPPRLGFLAEPQFGLGPDGAPAQFEARSARLRMTGQIEEVATAQGLEYFLQADFTRSPALIDARLTVALPHTWFVRAGLYKSAFSRELIVWRGDLLWTERSRVVSALAPARQVGVEVGAASLDEHLSITLGLFNGNGGRLEPNDNNHFLYIGRAVYHLPFERTRLQIGANAARSVDDGVAVGPVDSFAGTRTLWGADLYLEHKALVIAAEAVAARLDASAGPTTELRGFYLTVGYTLFERHQLLTRLDVFDDNRRPSLRLPASTTVLDLGYTLQLHPYVRLMANYGIPLERGASALLVRLQAGAR